MKQEINGVNLDWKARKVLNAVNENGGEADTSEVKTHTGLTSNQIIKYRFERLIEAGLITTHQPESPDGRPRAKQARLTNDAQQLLEDGELAVDVEPADDDLTIDERLEHLEKQVSAAMRTYSEVKSRIVELEEEVDQHEADMDGIADDIRQIRRYLDKGSDSQ